MSAEEFGRILTRKQASFLCISDLIEDYLGPGADCAEYPVRLVQSPYTFLRIRKEKKYKLKKHDSKVYRQAILDYTNYQGKSGQLAKDKQHLILSLSPSCTEEEKSYKSLSSTPCGSLHSVRSRSQANLTRKPLTSPSASPRHHKKLNATLSGSYNHKLNSSLPTPTGLANNITPSPDASSGSRRSSKHSTGSSGGPSTMLVNGHVISSPGSGSGSHSSLHHSNMYNPTSMTPTHSAPSGGPSVPPRTSSRSNSESRMKSPDCNQSSGLPSPVVASASPPPVNGRCTYESFNRPRANQEESFREYVDELSDNESEDDNGFPEIAAASGKKKPIEADAYSGRLKQNVQQGYSSSSGFVDDHPSFENFSRQPEFANNPQQVPARSQSDALKLELSQRITALFGKIGSSAFELLDEYQESLGDCVNNEYTLASLFEHKSGSLFFYGMVDTIFWNQESKTMSLVEFQTTVKQTPSPYHLLQLHCFKEIASKKKICKRIKLYILGLHLESDGPRLKLWRFKPSAAMPSIKALLFDPKSHTQERLFACPEFNFMSRGTEVVYEMV